MEGVETRRRRKKEEDKGSFCQKPGCGYQGFELYEIPMGQKTSKYTSKKSDRVVIDIMIKVCRACKKKFDKLDKNKD